MTRLTALRLLALDVPDFLLKPETINAAWRARVKASHPDLGNTNVLDFDALGEARDLLLADPAMQNNPCPQCKGRGIVHGAIGARPCGACRGTGEKNV